MNEALFYLNSHSIFRYRDMKRPYRILLSLVLMMFIFFVHAEAATSQGLDWGLEVSSQYNYDYVIKDENNETVKEAVFQFTVNTRPSIPDTINTWDELPTIDADVIWSNGTTVEEFALVWFMHAIDAEFVLPIGNWTFLTELYEDTAHFDGTVSDTSDYWGLDGTILVYGEATVHVDYLKTDGLMAHFLMNYYNGSITVIRQGLAAGIFDIIVDNILYMVVVVIVIAVVCIFYVKKK